MTKTGRKQSEKSRPQAAQPDGPSRFLHELRSLGIIVLIALALRATVVEAYIVPTGSMEKTIMIGDFLIGNKFVYGMRTPDWLGIPYTRLGFGIPWLRFPAFRQPRSGDVVIFKYPHGPQDKYVKRLVAGPGQTVEIRERETLVAEKPFNHPEHLQFLERKSQPKDWIDPNIFPRGNGNKDNYGRLLVPSRGDTLSAVHDRAVLWYVARMDGHTPHLVGNQILVDDQPITHYVVEQDYYFMMGDNRDQSYDSRFWGFVPHDHILGEALFVYFSLDFKRFPFITWNRLKRIGSVIH